MTESEKRLVLSSRTFLEIERYSAYADVVNIEMERMRQSIEKLAQDEKLDYSPSRIRWTIHAEVTARPEE